MNAEDENIDNANSIKDKVEQSSVDNDTEPTITPDTNEKKVNKPNTNKKLTRNKIVAAILAASLVVICSVGAFLLTTQRISLSKYAADVSLVSGQVEKSFTNGTWTELKNNDTVRQGDLVRVNGDGKAIITLDDGSAIRLDDNSKVELVSLDPKNIEIANKQGEVYTRVIKADRPFVVKVDGESFRALGTAYKTINSKTTKGVFVYESTVKDVTKNTDITEGKKLYVVNSSDSSVINKVLDITTEEIANDEFVQWNKQQDQTNEEFKKYMGVLKPATQTQTTTTETTQEQTQTTTQIKNTSTNTVASSINLSASASSTGVNLSWTASGIDTSKGYKIVKSTSINPVYPGSSYVYLTSGNSYSWKITDGATYYFRVCQYLGGSCGVYSDNVKVTAPYVADGVVTSISLAGTGSSISWTVDGYSDKGFKVAWSKTSSPTYPTRSTDTYHYLSSPDTRSDTINAFDSAGTYYVRVCEYLGGSCGVYSNEITVEL